MISGKTKTRVGWLSALTIALSLAGGCGDKKKGSSGEQCQRGGANCACRVEAPKCDEGLMCEQDKCTGFVETGGSVTNENARSCELLLVDEKGGAVLGVTFGENVEGTFVRQPPNTAVTFISKSDEPFTGEAFKLRFSGDAAPDLKDAKCADAKGEAIKGSPVTLGG